MPLRISVGCHVNMPRMKQGALHQRFRNDLPELVYGANDGVVTTLAIVAGVEGANLATHIVLILGFANLFADGISMGASNLLSQRSRDGNIPSCIGALPKAVATFIGFFVAGFVPLLAYILPFFDGSRFTLAAVLAALTLFIVGASRSLVTKQRWVPAGLEMLTIGASAGGIAYAVGLFGAFLTNLGS